MNVEITLQSESDTEQLGRQLAECLPEQCIVLLNGTLGAGKTRLVRAFATACGVAAGDITSPTFTLWQTYSADRLIHHLDAYRIADEDEFDGLGVFEVFDDSAVIFIEWASRVMESIPQAGRLEIDIDVVSETGRLVRLSTDDTEIGRRIETLTG